MNLDKAREAYRHDPQYRSLVEVLMHQIITLNMSPSEIREAAMFACILLEERSMSPLTMFRPNSDEYRRFVLGDWDTEDQQKKNEPAEAEETQP